MSVARQDKPVNRIDFRFNQGLMHIFHPPLFTTQPVVTDEWPQQLV